MSTKYSFNNWYSWFKKPDEIDSKQVDSKLAETKHSDEDDPWELRIDDKEIIRRLNRYTNIKMTNKDRRSSIKKSKTSLIVRRHKKKKQSHHTLQPKKDAYCNKLHKTEFGNSSSSKHQRHYKSSKSINDRDKQRNQDKQFNRPKQTNSGAGDPASMTAENRTTVKPSEYRKTIQRKEMKRIGEQQKPSRNEEVTQIKTRNKPLKKESMETTSPRIKNDLKNENRCRGVDSEKIENNYLKKENKEISQKVIDITTTSRDEARNSAHLSASRNILKKKEENLMNHSLEKKMCPKPIRTANPESDNAVKSLFSKVWPSDNSDEKIAKQNGQIPDKNNTSILHNKSKPLYEKEKQDTRRKTKIASSNFIDSKKKGIVKSNRNLRFEDENGKFKRNYSKPDFYKDSKTEKNDNSVPNSHKRLEQVKYSSEKSRSHSMSAANNKRVVFDEKCNIDSVNFISILKEIKSLKDQLKSLSDEDESKDCQTRTESKRKLECIEEEIIEKSPNSELMIPTSSNLQSFVPSPTVAFEKESPTPFNNDGGENLISSIQSAQQQISLKKSVVPDLTHDSSCHITPLLLSPPIALSDQEQILTVNPCETIKTGLEDTNDFSICQSPAKCLNFNGLEKHDCNMFLKRRIFYFKNYIPASERKNKKEVLMKKRLLSRLRTCNIPIKRKLDTTSSSNLRKIRCSSSSKEDIVHDSEAPAYDFSPYFKRSVPCTSFLERNSSVNPFLPYSDVSRCTSNSIMTPEKVWNYMCNIDTDKRAKSESSLKYLKEPHYSTSKLKVFENNANEEVSKIMNKQSIDRRKRSDRRSTIKSKQKAKMKTKKAKRKQKTNENQVDNVLKIENLSSHSDSIWKTISIEFNDVSLKCENPLSEHRLQLMLSQITEYLKTKTVQPNNLIITDVNIDSGIDNNNNLEDINITQQISNDADQLEPLERSDVCLDGFIIIDDYSASEKSSQTSTNDPPSTSDTDSKDPYVAIAREIQLLHENNNENKKEIEKIKEILKIKFPWLEKTIFDILTHYQKIPTDFPFMNDIEQVCYSISNFTFRKSLSNSKNVNCEYQQIKKFKIFSGSNNSIAKELARKDETIEYRTVENNYNSLEIKKNNKKSKISYFTKNIRRIFRVFVGKKKH